MGKSTASPIPRVTGLLPCPFCGGTNHYMDSMVIDESDEYFICCTECGCEGPVSAIAEIAEKLWDARPVL